MVRLVICDAIVLIMSRFYLEATPSARVHYEFNTYQICVYKHVCMYVCRYVCMDVHVCTISYQQLLATPYGIQWLAKLFTRIRSIYYSILAWNSFINDTFCWKSTGDRWITHTNCQKCGKRVHITIYLWSWHPDNTVFSEQKLTEWKDENAGWMDGPILTCQTFAMRV